MEGSSNSQQEADTLLEVILYNCEKYADKTALHWVNEDLNVTEHYTYTEVEERTREIAAGLQQLLREGPNTDPLTRERAVLCYPPGLEFILVFIASLRAGIIAVPVSPPNPTQSQYTTENLLRIIHDSGASFVLTSSDFYHETTMLEFITNSSPIPWHCEITTELIECGPDHGNMDKIKSDNIALLQYTSGSTGHPKGVMITHGNLLHNSQLVKAYTHADSSLVEISFVPHFHDMGLVTSYLQTLYVGGKGYFMAPSTYIKNPTIWIQAFSKFKGTHGKAPNFTFDLILKRPLPMHCNLSSVRCISNASVMVLYDTIQKFEKAFASFGLKKNTIRPAYGLAEHTVALTAIHNEDDPVIINGRISCGTPLLGVVIKIVDPDTCVELPDGEEGEIWVDSASKALGYWEKEDETQKTFEAELDDFSDRTYLRTGDLGFMKNGELIFVGRTKDLIIIRGRNIHPIDIEEKLESTFKVLRTGRTVAFQHDVDGDSDSVGYVAELINPTTYSQAELMTLSSNIAATISINFQVSVSLVVFIQPKTMPRTTSGKKQRSKCKLFLTKGSLQEVFRWTPSKQSSKPLIQPSVEIRVSEEVPMEVDERESKSLQVVSSSSSSDHLEALPTFTERRRSAPPLPKDPNTRIAEQFRRKSVSERKSSGIRRTASDQAHSRRNSLQTLTATISSVLGVNIQPESNLWAHGCNSVKAMELSKRLQSEFGFAIEPHLLFTHQTPMALLAKLQRSLLSMGSPPEVLKENTKKDNSKGDEDEGVAAPMRSRAFSAESSLARKFSLMNVRTKRRSDTLLTLAQSVKETRANGHESDSIAVLGMSCSFPGCSNITEFWDLLMSKTTTTTSHSDPNSGETFNGGFTSTTGTFDHKWFGVSEWEASSMDPQQYMLLHSVWECLHHARCVPVTGRDKDWGVFVGIGTGTTTSHNGSQSPRAIPPATSVATNVAANRIARFFNFTGPIQSIDTACASSLSALDSACMYLKAGKCSAALVCGVNTLLDPYQFTVLKKMGMLSPDDKTRTFDKLANGYVRGEGCGSILLMPLTQARNEGKRVLAVIRSTATNNNGTLSATMTAPSLDAQTKLLKTVLSTANLDSEAIQYIEAHGTGTKVGDPIEGDALRSVVGSKTRSKLYNPPVVGGCKANIGHLETASGMASLIKTVLVLEHAKAPGNVGFVELNSSYANKDDLCVSKECKYLNGDTDLSTALVNSFGFGGTNATTILQQYRPLPHLAYVKCHLLFSTYTSNPLSTTGYSYLKELKASVNFFKLKFPALQEALVSCEEALQKVSDHLKLNTRLGEYQKDAAIFKLCYSVAVLLQSLDVEISLIGATDYVGEIVALVTAGALNLHDAMTLLVSVPNQSSLLQVSKSFQTPRLPIQSCTGMLYYPSMWQNDESRTKYLKQLVSTCFSSQGKRTNLGHNITEMMSMQERQVELITCITVDRHTPMLTLEDGVGSSETRRGVFIAINEIMEHISVRSMQDQSSKDKMQYLREKFLELRDMSDKISYNGCTNKPTKTTEKMSPTFYQRYPLRAMIDSRVPMPTESGTRSSRRKQSTLSTTSSVSVGDESGYITQANSAESLNAMVPSHMTDMYTLTSMTLSLNLTERNLSPKQNTAEEKVWQVMTAITEEFHETFGSMNMTLEEISNTGLFQLGLNSLKLMQLADLLVRKFDVDMNISDIIEYETLGEIAKAIVEESRVFIGNNTSPTLKAVAESIEFDAYPQLTKVDYYTIPPIEVIRSTEPQEDGSLSFNNFTIGRNGVKIVFQGETDVSNLSLDKLVHIQGQQVTLCNDPNQPKSSVLNKPSLIYFDLHSTPNKSIMETCTRILYLNDSLDITTWKYDCISGMFAMEVSRFY